VLARTSAFVDATVVAVVREQQSCSKRRGLGDAAVQDAPAGNRMAENAQVEPRFRVCREELVGSQIEVSVLAIAVTSTFLVDPTTWAMESAVRL